MLWRTQACSGQAPYVPTVRSAAAADRTVKKWVREPQAVAMVNATSPGRTELISDRGRHHIEQRRSLSRSRVRVPLVVVAGGRVGLKNSGRLA